MLKTNLWSTKSVCCGKSYCFLSFSFLTDTRGPLAAMEYFKFMLLNKEPKQTTNALHQFLFTQKTSTIPCSNRLRALSAFEITPHNCFLLIEAFFFCGDMFTQMRKLRKNSQQFPLKATKRTEAWVCVWQRDKRWEEASRLGKHWDPDVGWPCPLYLWSCA